MNTSNIYTYINNVHQKSLMFSSLIKLCACMCSTSAIHEYKHVYYRLTCQRGSFDFMHSVLICFVLPPEREKQKGGKNVINVIASQSEVALIKPEWPLCQDSRHCLKKQKGGKNVINVIASQSEVALIKPEWPLCQDSRHCLRKQTGACTRHGRNKHKNNLLQESRQRRTHPIRRAGFRR